jgi:DNA-binding transcriptional MerR regulator/methylmalonyl-CoA mutase cobalamin-binding subunit
MFDHFSNEPVFNVKAVSHQTGVAAATLRAWERRYGVPTPPRTDSGYRLYSARDVAMVRWLKSQIENGMSISQAVQLLKAVESQSLNGNGNGAAPLRIVQSTLPSSFQRLHDDITKAAVDFDESRIERALNEAFSLFPVEDVCLKVVQPVLITLGVRWHAGQINVSVEHFTTNIMRRKLLSMMALSPAPSREARIVSACAPGEYHELGILMLSLFLRRAGFDVIYLGQSISTTRLEEMLAKTQPDLLLLSASGLVAAGNLLDVAEVTLAHHGRQRWVLAFGGRIFNKLPELQKHVPGLYVGEDAEAALQQITEMMARTQDAPFVAQSAGTNNAMLLPALTEFRLRRPEIISSATRLIQSRLSGTLDYKRASEANENLLEIIDAALRFNEPEVLREPSNWRWDALPPDGMTFDQLGMCAAALVDSTRLIVSDPHLASLQPFLEAIELSVEQP